jgi:hypothetical protein
LHDEEDKVAAVLYRFFLQLITTEIARISFGLVTCLCIIFHFP